MLEVAMKALSLALVTVLVTLLALLLLISPTEAKPLPRYGLFVFSSLCWERESGDADGARLILIRLPGSDSGRFSYTGEGPLDEAPIEDLQIDGKSGRISFRFLTQYDPVSGKSNVYVSEEGIVSAEGFDQKGVDGKMHRTSRVIPPQKAIPVCR
jgi:hypothetical protein